MSYGLSFSRQFFYPENLESANVSSQPQSVYQALVAIQRDTWESLASNVFGVASDRLDVHTVMDRILETNTCTYLTSPVEVWIDDQGEYRVEVHDGPWER